MLNQSTIPAFRTPGGRARTMDLCGVSVSSCTNHKRLGHGVVVRFSLALDRSYRPRLGQPIGVTERKLENLSGNGKLDGW